MKGIVYRSAALALVLVVAFSALALPVSATDYQSTYNFWNWAYDNSWFLGKAIIGFSAGNVCQVSEDRLHHATTHSGGGGSVDGQRVYNCVCDYCGQEFQAVATDLKNTYSDYYENQEYTSIDSSNRVFNANNWTLVSTSNENMEIITTGYDFATVKRISDNQPTLLWYYYFTPDKDCIVYFENDFTYTTTFFTSYASKSGVTLRVNGSSNNLSCASSDGIKSFNCAAGTTYIVRLPICYGKNADTSLKGLTETFYFNFPKVWFSVYPSTLNVDDNRPSVFNPSFSYEDEDGKETVSDQQIIDEQGLNYYNPVTNTTTNITNWTYDYSDRSYTCTTENNTTTTITYGDEYITINEGDVNNTYITYNIYYYTTPEDSGDGSGSGDSSDDGDGIGGGLGELLGSLLGGLIDLITGLISGLIDSLINLVEMTIEKLGQVVNLFGEFGDALKVLWSWLPGEVVTILAAGVSVVVFASVIKLFV